LLRKGVNLSFCRKHVLALNFAFISELKHIPWGAQKMQFSGGWKKDKKRRERVGKHWIGAEKPMRVFSRSAGRRFLTRVLIQIGGDGSWV